MGLGDLRMFRREALHDCKRGFTVSIACEQAVELQKTLGYIGGLCAQQALQMWNGFAGTARVDQQTAQGLAGVEAGRIDFVPKLGRFEGARVVALEKGDLGSALREARVARAAGQLKIFGQRHRTCATLPGDLGGNQFIEHRRCEIDLRQRCLTGRAIGFAEHAAARPARRLGRFRGLVVVRFGNAAGGRCRHTGSRRGLGACAEESGA